MAYTLSSLRPPSRISVISYFALSVLPRHRFSTDNYVRSRKRVTNNEDNFFGENNEPSAYRSLKVDKEVALQARLRNSARFQPIGERDERSIYSTEIQKAASIGKYFGMYRGIDILKGPVELMVFMQMLWHVKPRTLFELGAYTGASAIWYADMLKLSDVECNIYSVDIDLSLLQKKAKEFQPPNVVFLEGDSNEIETIFPSKFLKQQPHPWIIIEDVHEGLENVVAYFHDHMSPGDYFVCEDTSPDLATTMGAGGIYDTYERVGSVKLDAWKSLLGRYGDMYAVDTFFTDMYGYNSSANWDSFVKRMK